MGKAEGRPMVSRERNVLEKANSKGREIKQGREQKSSRGEAQSLGETSDK